MLSATFLIGSFKCARVKDAYILKFYVSFQLYEFQYEYIQIQMYLITWKYKTNP